MKNNRSIYLRFSTIVIIILLASFSRLIPHPPNFTPINAIALFGASYFAQRYLAFLIPLIGLWLSDMVINNVLYAEYFAHFVWFYPGFYWTYGAFLVSICLSSILLKKITIQKLVITSLISSISFFLISNFGVWISFSLYPHTLQGLITCYIAGLPFFKNTLLGDLFYVSLLFGSFELAQKYIPLLKTNSNLLLTR